MKHLKKFNNEQSLINYKKNNFITPHLFLNNQVKSFDYMPKYQVFDYISSTLTGGQYIDLGCMLMENTDDIQIDIKFNIHNVGDAQGSLLGCKKEISPYPGFVLRSSNVISDGIEFCAKWNFNDNTINLNNGYYLKSLSYKQFNTSYNQNIKDTILERSIYISNIPQEQCHQLNTYLFCASNSSNQPFRYCVADLYYLKLYKGGQLIRNLIPVKKLSTNEVGLYDLENDHLYVSQGNEPFVEPII